MGFHEFDKSIKYRYFVHIPSKSTHFTLTIDRVGAIGPGFICSIPAFKTLFCGHTNKT